VTQILEHFLTVLQNGMGRTSLDVHHRTNAAGIVLGLAIIQALVFWIRAHQYST
jgi:imidazoleglycerol phosphate dehydratase HisB